jgi:molybdopterin-guanine dinucleotide biosynthesis protein MobB
MDRATIPAVAFVGRQNSGKTTLLEKLIEALDLRGVRVATVKHHSHAGFEFDVEGKDSQRHYRAGSIHTVIAAPDRIASVRRTECEVSVRQIIDMMAFEASVLGDFPDLILVEGYRQGELPTVELFRADNPKDAQRELVTEGSRLIAVATDIGRVGEQARAQGLAVFALDDTDSLADFLIDRFIDRY